MNRRLSKNLTCHFSYKINKKLWRWFVSVLSGLIPITIWLESHLSQSFPANVSNDENNAFCLSSRLVVYKFMQLHYILKWLAANEVHFPFMIHFQVNSLRIGSTTNLLTHIPWSTSPSPSCAMHLEKWQPLPPHQPVKHVATNLRSVACGEAVASTVIGLLEFKALRVPYSSI